MMPTDELSSRTKKHGFHLSPSLALSAMLDTERHSVLRKTPEASVRGTRALSSVRPTAWWSVAEVCQLRNSPVPMTVPWFRFCVMVTKMSPLGSWTEGTGDLFTLFATSCV